MLHYRLLAKLGEGGMGVVWKAEDTRLHRQVALKLVPEERDADPDAVDRHLREARAASALNHPHICAVHDIGEAEGRRFIVLELLEGQTLLDRIGGSPLPIDATVRLTIQVADALAAAHAKGIVHRDLKSANIFITQRGEAKLLDFGLAKLAAGPPTPDAETRTELGATRPGTVVGTVAYMSPEQALGREVDHRTDLFSLGAVLYEMLTGRRAFDGDTSAAVFDAVLNRTPAAPATVHAAVPPALDRIVHRLLEKDPALRYQSAADLVADLRRLQRDATSAPVAADAAAKRLAPRRRLAAAAALLAAVAIVGILLSRARWREEAPAPAAGGAAIADSRGPTLAVLPFVNASGDPEQEYFSDGLTEDIISELSRYRELSVLARSSTGRYKDSDLDLSAIGRELGSRYLLRGTVRRSGDRIRLGVELSSTADGRAIWGTNMEGDLTARDLFALQDELTQQVVNAVAGNYGPLARAELSLARRKPPDSLVSYDCVLRVYEYLQVHTGENHLAARDCLQSVLGSDSEYADGLAWLAYLYGEQYHHRWIEGEDGREVLDRALELAERAVRLDPTSHVPHGALAVTLFFAGDAGRAKTEIRRAIELNPNNALWLSLGGAYLAQQDDFETAVAMTRRSIALQPHPPDWIGMTFFFEAYRAGRFEEALEEARGISMHGDFREPLFVAATLGQLGRADEARAALDELEARWGRPISGLRAELIERHAFSAAMTDHLLEGLAKAGLQGLADASTSGATASPE